MGGPPPTRGIAGASSGQNCPLSEIVSMLCEPIATSSKHGFEKISSSDVLSQIDKLNSNLQESTGPRLVGEGLEPETEMTSFDQTVGVNTQ